MMRSVFRLTFAILMPCIALLALPCFLISQQIASSLSSTIPANLPESPQPPIAQVADPSSSQQIPPQQTPAAQGSSSSQTPSQDTDAGKSQRETAAEQLKEQEH